MASQFLNLVIIFGEPLKTSLHLTLSMWLRARTLKRPIQLRLTTMTGLAIHLNATFRLPIQDSPILIFFKIHGVENSWIVTVIWNRIKREWVGFLDLFCGLMTWLYKNSLKNFICTLFVKGDEPFFPLQAYNLSLGIVLKMCETVT